MREEDPWRAHLRCRAIEEHQDASMFSRAATAHSKSAFRHEMGSTMFARDSPTHVNWCSEIKGQHSSQDASKEPEERKAAGEAGDTRRRQRLQHAVASLLLHQKASTPRVQNSISGCFWVCEIAASPIFEVCEDKCHGNIRHTRCDKSVVAVKGGRASAFRPSLAAVFVPQTIVIFLSGKIPPHV